MNIVHCLMVVSKSESPRLVIPMMEHFASIHFSHQTRHMQNQFFLERILVCTKTCTVNICGKTINSLNCDGGELHSQQKEEQLVNFKNSHWQVLHANNIRKYIGFTVFYFFFHNAVVFDYARK